MFTPGPWIYDQWGQIWGAPDQQSKHENGRPFLAHVVDEKGKHHPHVDNGRLNEMGIADARLIAAAPDLLEACKAVEKICDILPNTLYDVRPLIKAAIAKAEGRKAACSP